MWILISGIYGRRAAMNYVDVYQKDQEYPHTELLKLLGV